MKSREERRAEFKRIDAWFEDLYKNHPFQHWTIAILLGMAVLNVAALIQFGLNWLARALSH